MSQEPRIVFVLCHSYTVNEGDPDHEETETKRLYYSLSREKCVEQIEYYSKLPGFRDFPEGLEVLKIELETQYWETGVIKWDEA
jgi:hypothetical protein